MKAPFLAMVLGLLYSVTSLATPIDSILVRIGPHSKVLFYGSNKADLKKLENYDWNTILRDLNARLNQTTPAEPRQHYIDLTGKSYLSDSSLRSANATVKVSELEIDKPLTKQKLQSGWQDFRNRAQFNLLLGWPTLLPPSSNPPDLYPTWLDGYYLKSSASRRFAANLIVPFVLQRVNPRTNLFIDLGIEFSLTRFRSSQDFYYRSGDSFATHLPPGSPVNYNETIVYLEGYGRFIHQPLIKRTFNATYLDLLAIPSLQFYDAAGRRTFQLGLGAFVGPRIGTNIRTVVLADQGLRVASKEAPEVSPYSPIQGGLILKLAYRDFALLTRYHANSHGIIYGYKPKQLSINLQIPLL